MMRFVVRGSARQRGRVSATATPRGPTSASLPVAGVGDAGERHRLLDARPARTSCRRRRCATTRPPASASSDRAVRRARRRRRSSPAGRRRPSSRSRRRRRCGRRCRAGRTRAPRCRRRRRRRSCRCRARRARLKRCAAASSFSTRPAFAGDVELAGRRADRVQVEEFGIVGAVEPRLPGLAAVGGAKDQVVRADDVAVVARRRTRRRGTACRRPAPCSASLRRAASSRSRTPARAATLRSIAATSSVVGLAAVELQLPGGAAVGGVQDHAVVADGPALLVVDEVHRGEVGAHRHRRLLPRRAAVGRDDDVAALADGDQPLAGPRHRLQQAACSRAATSAPACRARRRSRRRAPARRTATASASDERDDAGVRS